MLYRQNWCLSKFQANLKLRPTFHDELHEGGPDLLKLVYAQVCLQFAHYQWAIPLKLHTDGQWSQPRLNNRYT